MSSLPEELRKTILLVDDQVDVLTVVRRILERAHFHVIQAPSGARALKLAEEASTPIHLLLTDVDMPGMSGPELQRELLARRHAIPIIFITAQIDASIRSGLMQRGAVACLFKPFSQKELQTALNAALAAG